MNEQPDFAESLDSKPLEDELRAIWQNAANTRKKTASHRVAAILDHSQAELSLRNSCHFFIYLGEACALLAAALVPLFFTTTEHPSQTQDTQQ